MIDSVKTTEAGDLSYFVLTPGEESKNISTLEEIYNRMSEANLGRDSVVIALGGGVVGDIAGFAAATYMRGIEFIQVPTSLLAMVDSSIGGKTGINLIYGKNLVGAFWQPSFVLINPSVLDSLNPREIRHGLAEIIKYGIILDKDFFQYLSEYKNEILNLERKAIEYVIYQSCRIKADVIEKDEREQNFRAVLNYGHTFAHAIEVTTGYNKYTHGEAVSIGMMMAAELGFYLNFISENEHKSIQKILIDYQLPIKAEGITADVCYKAMYKDKKNSEDKIKFILPTRIGSVAPYTDISSELVKKAIEEYLK